MWDGLRIEEASCRWNKLLSCSLLRKTSSSEFNLLNSENSECEGLSGFVCSQTACDWLCDRLCDRLCDWLCDRLCDWLCDRFCDRFCDRLCDRLCD